MDGINIFMSDNRDSAILSQDLDVNKLVFTGTDTIFKSGPDLVRWIL